MHYIITKDGKKVFGPAAWDQKKFMLQLGKQGVNNISLPTIGPIDSIDFGNVVLKNIGTTPSYDLYTEDVYCGDSGYIKTTKSPEKIASELAYRKKRSKEKVNNAAEIVRKQYVTLTIGQALEYESLRAEITAYMKDTKPTESDYPWLSATIGIEADDLAGVVAVVTEKMSEWDTEGPKIRRDRIAKLKQIDETTTSQELENI